MHCAGNAGFPIRKKSLLVVYLKSTLPYSYNRTDICGPVAKNFFALKSSRGIPFFSSVTLKEIDEHLQVVLVEHIQQLWHPVLHILPLELVLVDKQVHDHAWCGIRWETVEKNCAF